MLVRAIVDRGAVNTDKSYPGDLIAGGENILAGALATVGAGVWTGAQIASGIINRTGPTAAYADVTDTAVNILTALKGNQSSVEVVPGTSFRLLVKNTVAFANTVTGGTGVALGTGTVNIAASLWREYLITVLNSQRQNVVQAVTVNGSAQVLFQFPSGQTAYSLGPNANYDFTNGANVTGTGIPAATTVLGVLTNGAGVYGVTLSANATADAPNGVAVTFGPAIQLDGLRSGTL